MDLITPPKPTGPRVSSGTDSRQDYATPREFLAVVERRFGLITLDLAAHQGNHRVPRWYGPGGEREDSFAGFWPDEGLLWLNPPFNDIAKWAGKCAYEQETCGAQILLLVPAAVGTNWWRDFVAPHAETYLMNGRLRFEGATDPFPKDLMLCHFNGHSGIRLWDWRTDTEHRRWVAVP